MDDDVAIPDLQLQMPEGFEIPMKHEQPKTTLDSLIQIKNEFDSKVKETNDASKKRRYQRQLKQFEDAIKATKEGKQFNYTELVVPPGFAQIPLQNGKPILTGSSSQSTRPPSVRPAPTPAVPSQQSHPTSKPSLPKQEVYDNLADDTDDIINQLEAEIDDNDLGEDSLDPEEEKFNRQIEAATSFIPKHLLKPPPSDDIPDDIIINEIDPFSSKKKPPPMIAPVKPQPKPALTKPSQIVQPQPQLIPSPVKQTVSPLKPKSQSKELNIIMERQRLFKEAALNAKKEGNTSVALVYLRHAKGFESMITAAENGLPLDMSNLPVPPQLADKIKKTSSSNIQLSPNSKLSNAISNIRIEDDLLPMNGDRDTVYKYLLKTLKEQVDKATENFKHFTNMGDISNANKFNQLARESIQDLEAVRNAHKLGQPVPLYHYERRSYETVDCNSDLTDNDLELTIIRAINLTLPKDHKVDNMNTFVKFEFPYPTEEVQSDKTKVQNGTCSPGFLRSDKLLYTCQVKLQPLENLSTIHDAFDLLEGRRQTGGKLEIKLRIREPILHKEIKHLEFKLLIIDKFQKATL